MNNAALESHIKFFVHLLIESRNALWTYCLTERNLLALSNATFKKLLRLNVYEKAKNVLENSKIQKFQYLDNISSIFSQR